MSKRTRWILIGGGVLVLIAALTVTLILTICPHRRQERVERRAPTCTEAGEEARVCSRCGKTVSVAEIPALGHLWRAWEVVDAPTEENAGEAARVCDRDETHRETKEIPALDETNYTRRVIETPTCTKAGVAEYVSEAYGTFRAAIPRLPHALDDGTCTVCGERMASAGLTYELSADGAFYRVSDAEHRLTDTALIVPESHRGLPVREIAAEAFAERTWLRSVVIPESIGRIGDGAFSGAGITEIRFNAVRCADFNARNWVFYPADPARELRLIVGKSVERLPARMFYPLVTDPLKLPRLKSVAFETGCALTEIGDYAFYRAAELTQCALPARLETIGASAFYGCGLRVLDFPDTLTDIGAGAFGACEALRDVAFGKGLRRVGDDAFNYCVALRSVRLEGTATESVGKDAFKNCFALAEASLGDCRLVGESAFMNDAALTRVSFGEGLRRIAASAFRACARLDTLTLPAGLTELGDGAFADCVALTALDYRAVACGDFAAGNEVFAACGTAGEGMAVRIAAGVERIPARMFYATSDVSRAPNLSGVTIEAAGLVSVGDYAFFGMSPVETAYVGSAAQWRDVQLGKGNEALDEIACGRV